MAETRKITDYPDEMVSDIIFPTSNYNITCDTKTDNEQLAKMGITQVTLSRADITIRNIVTLGGVHFDINGDTNKDIILNGVTFKEGGHVSITRKLSGEITRDFQPDKGGVVFTKKKLITSQHSTAPQYWGTTADPFTNANNLTTKRAIINQLNDKEGENEAVGGRRRTVKRRRGHKKSKKSRKARKSAKYN